MRNWGPAQAITRDEHDAIVARRRRSVTDDGMRPAKPDPDTAESRPSLIDRYIQPKGTP